MKRPQLVHFLCIITDHNINIKASVVVKDINKTIPASIPSKELEFLEAHQFAIKLVGLGQHRETAYENIFESNLLGNFDFKIPFNDKTRHLKAFQLYEISYLPKWEIYLGTFIPLYVQHPKKVIICDFDKTLIETNYSSLESLYKSLTTPLNKFPDIKESQNIISSYIKKGFDPFIVSSSPHFYENLIRDWLYSRHIYPAGIFLKDYRIIFSPFHQELSIKDIMVQGPYKLGQLVNILLMTGIPSELILMGDNFDIDPLIYLTLTTILLNDHEPWTIWRHLKETNSFKLNKRQDASFLNHFYFLRELINSYKKDYGQPKITIYIRKKSTKKPPSIPELYQEHIDSIKYYGET